MEGVPFPRPSVDLRAPPSDLDAFFAWFEAVSSHLVLLEEYPLAEIRSACAEARRRLAEHIRAPLPPGPDRATAPAAFELYLRLAADHRWFERSLEQLDWFLGIVEREDHGGHRQALGQYGRILAESVRRHRQAEAEFRSAARGPPRPGAPGQS